MSEWTPRVGDKVMVGEWGPCEVRATHADRGRSLIGAPGDDDWVRNIWLTPAPEPEPGEPTAFGALVRDGDGAYLARSTDDDYPWVQLNGSEEGGWERWVDLSRPITVVLADPAEVEQLRVEVGVLREQVDRFQTERDELQRRIDKVLHEVDRDGYATKAYLHQHLRGES